MKKNTKRIVALSTSIGIVLLSLAFGRLSKVEDEKKQEVLQEQTYKSLETILYNGKVSGKNIIKDGDKSSVIQKISINGVIDAPMTDEESKYSVINQIKLAKEDSNVQAILLSVNTPGGGVYESAEIYKELIESGKDVYVSMKKLATSGGYYVSMASKKIFANEETTTGSLGVIMSSLSAQKFLEDKGIKNQVIRSGEQKAVGGLAEDLPESTLAIYKELNKEAYDKFVNVISKGRNMSKEKVLQLADGRIYSATQAIKNGLIDKIGNEKDLIEEIKKDKNLSNPQIIEYKNINHENSLLKNFVKAISNSVIEELNDRVYSTNDFNRSYLG